LFLNLTHADKASVSFPERFTVFSRPSYGPTTFWYLYGGGVGGSYATLTTAVADLISKGVNSPVIFKLKTGTFNEQVIIGAIPGASTTNLITFEAESGNAQDVLLTFPSTSTNNYVIRFDNASFITFRNVRIEPTGPTYTRGHTCNQYH
jgi:pectin methylesterase-like acyl-CoA thioesterase